MLEMLAKWLLTVFRAALLLTHVTSSMIAAVAWFTDVLATLRANFRIDGQIFTYGTTEQVHQLFIIARVKLSQAWLN